ncbi:MAG: TIGR00725 family protein [Planctomycetes bacterium]|nr:TIGR00725 family protein [Planctomycetota bacterium]
MDVRQISVIGAGDCTPREAESARRVGALLARAGVVVITGGLGGVMEAASRGAVEAGGLTVGVLPTDRLDDANPWVRVPLATGMGDARNVIIAGSAKVVIAIGGRLGTLAEIAFARKRGIPVIGLDSWEIDADRAATSGVVPAVSPEDAVARALELLGRSPA